MQIEKGVEKHDEIVENRKDFSPINTQPHKGTIYLVNSDYRVTIISVSEKKTVKLFCNNFYAVIIQLSCAASC